VGSADGSGIEPIAIVAMPGRFDARAKKPNNTTMQYGSRFDTSRKIIQRNQQLNKSYPFRQYIVPHAGTVQKSNKINVLYVLNQPPRVC
jgi:hypothetical protein